VPPEPPEVPFDDIASDLLDLRLWPVKGLSGNDSVINPLEQTNFLLDLNLYYC